MRILPAVFCLVALSCSTGKTDTQKAKDLIRDHLFNSLHDFKSYEVVSFGKLDSSFTRLSDDPAFIQARYTFDSLLAEQKTAIEEGKDYLNYTYIAYKAKPYLEKATLLSNKAKLLLPVIDSLEKNFQAHFNGWKMAHSYRAKNLSGNLGIHHYMYYFNKSVDTIYSQLNISDSNDSTWQKLNYPAKK